MILMAAPASSSMSVLRVSCPGMGFTITIGVAVAMDSAVVRPPGLDTMRSVAIR